MVSLGVNGQKRGGAVSKFQAGKPFIFLKKNNEQKSKRRQTAICFFSAWAP